MNSANIVECDKNIPIKNKKRDECFICKFYVDYKILTSIFYLKNIFKFLKFTYIHTFCCKWLENFLTAAYKFLAYNNYAYFLLHVLFKMYKEFYLFLS